jgi:hypothetical protein
MPDEFKFLSGDAFEHPARKLIQADFWTGKITQNSDRASEFLAHFPNEADNHVQPFVRTMGKI